jgi:hypothetical protein
MALHQTIQRVLLVGVRLGRHPPPPPPRPPPVLAPLMESVAVAHRKFDALALQYGHRYRSGFWAIYLLSALAVLCAVLPLALGWDSAGHRLHSFAALWALGEVLVIGSVSAIYWRGHRGDWQEQWLSARTTAELTWYLPVLAPLLDFTAPATQTNWYLRVFDPGQHLRTVDEVAALCARNEQLARQLLANAWSDPQFIETYSVWTVDILRQQVHYHHGVEAKQHALQHRVHYINTWLFGLTAFAASIHLFIHTLWLSLVTTFFPALGASLHGALAQAESSRLTMSSKSLAAQLEGAIERIRGAAAAGGSAEQLQALKNEIKEALALILDEHQGWHLLVRPHQLPLG